MKPKPPEKTKKATKHRTPSHWDEMNRKQRREMMRKIQSEDLRLEVVHPDAAGIDIGNASHYVPVPAPTRDSQAVRRFRCTTDELKALAHTSLKTVCPLRSLITLAQLQVHLRRGRGYKNLAYLLLKAQRIAVTKTEFIVLREAA